MNSASISILAAVIIFFALAVWRVAKRGVPCECGGSRKVCGGKCCCCEHDESAEK
ncbi:MAG: FeoB-associated Cys-rich membrane protein [Kiritimatiellae bacterium]|nr:FeoB-associated Cys-rich membrane protein [Kiritimatiellia bacterium]